MTYSGKIAELRNKIYASLSPLISSSCVLWDLPYYSNIGDTLIWEGTECFIKELSVECLSRCAYQTFSYKPLSKDVTILLQGGGNWGDLWRMHQDFRLKIIELYPDNKIIILPQSVHYQNQYIFENDAELMGKHQNLTICVRDKKSYAVLEKYFHRNHLLLLPDMAFCISRNILDKYRSKGSSKVLFLKRSDSEFCNKDYKSLIREDERALDTRDWPTIEHVPFSFRLMGVLMRLRLYKMMDYFAVVYLKEKMVKSGVMFLDDYRKIYTTRLHVAIMSVLLDKPCVFFDNSYGKNSSFYDTWLKELNNISFID